MIRVLLVDDEASEARMLRRAVRVARGVPAIHVDDCRSARAALKRVRERRFEVVIVDRGLDDMDGLALGRELRRCGYSGGLMMLTGRFMLAEDECDALAAGFDDYLRKPADVTVLLERIVALARRTAASGSAGDAEPDGQPGAALWVSPDAPEAMVFARTVKLTDLQWKLLHALYRRDGHAVRRETIVWEMWGPNPPAAPGDALRHHLCQLRKALGVDAKDLIETLGECGLRLDTSKS